MQHQNCSINGHLTKDIASPKPYNIGVIYDCNPKGAGGPPGSISDMPSNRNSIYLPTIGLNSQRKSFKQNIYQWPSKAC